MADKDRILLFVKAAEKGKVKSRLASAIGEEAALEVYKCLTEDLLEKLKRSDSVFRICFFPPDARGSMMNWLGPGHVYWPQQGADLGERMKSAFIRSFLEGVERAVLIGSDIPDVTPSLLREAFESLRTHDVVIGPALDGGYYLIGFNAGSFLPFVFDGIAWSTDRVFEQTIDNLARAGRRVYRLQPLQDIDRPEDLRAFVERKTPKSPEPATAIRCILRHKELFQ